MTDTFANLPPALTGTITTFLDSQPDGAWLNRAKILHEKYTHSVHARRQNYYADADDVLAYLALRMPATYAQFYGALASVAEMLPTWKPVTVLDIGAGPGTGMWAATHVWDSLKNVSCIERERAFSTYGKKMQSEAHFQADVAWEQYDLSSGLHDDTKYDLVLIGNVLNELSPSLAEKILGQAYSLTKGVLVILEPGTPSGSQLIASCASKLARAGTLIAPYLNNSYVHDESYWLHFPQRFIRPEFQRRLRQIMRESSDMASDWEEAKYSYAAISTLSAEITPYARVVGKVQLQKGFLELPILTAQQIEKVKVLKRNKDAYSFAKNLNWGELIMQKTDLFPAPQMK